MEIFADGRVYLSRGERFPFQCPQCGHIMEYRESNGMIVCEKCDCEGTAEDFSRTTWKLTKVN